MLSAIHIKYADGYLFPQAMFYLTDPLPIKENKLKPTFRHLRSTSYLFMTGSEGEGEKRKKNSIQI